jgi:hypothetical protein
MDKDVRVVKGWEIVRGEGSGDFVVVEGWRIFSGRPGRERET